MFCLLLVMHHADVQKPPDPDGEALEEKQMEHNTLTWPAGLFPSVEKVYRIRIRLVSPTVSSEQQDAPCKLYTAPLVRLRD
jgi:hypothetical protein